MPRKAKGRPPRAPLRKKRLVGRVVRERMVWKRQRLPQEEPTAAERTAVRVRMRLEMFCREVIGAAVRVLSFGMERARVTVVMKRARRGTERRIWCRNAVLQLGTLG